MIASKRDASRGPLRIGLLSCLLLQGALMPQLYLAFTQPTFLTRTCPRFRSANLGVQARTSNATVTEDELDLVAPIESRMATSSQEMVDDDESSDDDTWSEAQESQQRAIEQVGAILDLYNSTSPTISNVVVSKAVEGLLLRIYYDQTIEQRVIAQVESLLWKSYFLRASPTHRSLDTLWLLQQRQWEVSKQRLKPGQQIGRSVNLLRRWIVLSEKVPSSEIPNPPYEYIHSVFSLTNATNRTMSYSLWDLYQDVRFSGVVPRLFFDLVLQILANSPSTWNARQCHVLQDMERLHQSTNSSLFAPSIDDMEKVLWLVARAGKVPEATWLFRKLCDMQSQQSNRVHVRYLDAWYRALCNSQDQGSTFYLERLLEAARNNCPSHDYLNHLHRTECYDLLLRRYLKTQKSGSGMRAEKLFNKLVTAYELEGTNSSLQPNQASLSLVVQCYLHEGNGTLQESLDAYRFMKQYVPKLRVVTATSDGKEREERRSFQMFYRLLASLAQRANSNHKAAVACENLFRMFLSAYNEGKVSERPNPGHLELVLKVIHKHRGKEGTDSSLEMVRMMGELHRSGKIPLGPSQWNRQQLVATIALAKSGTG